MSDALVELLRAFDAVLNILGAATAAKIPTINTTTTSSTKLKAECFLTRGETVDEGIRSTIVEPNVRSCATSPSNQLQHRWAEFGLRKPTFEICELQII